MKLWKTLACVSLISCANPLLGAEPEKNTSIKTDEAQGTKDIKLIEATERRNYYDLIRIT